MTSQREGLDALLDHLGQVLPPQSPLEAVTHDLRTTRRALYHLQRSAERLLAAVASGAQDETHSMALRLSEAIASTRPYTTEE